MKTQHTPGPWSVRKHEKGYVVYYTDGDTRSNTAQCYENVVAEEHGTAEANARLIAAAPELLAALQESVLGMAALLDETSHMKETEGGNICWEAYKKAQAAIAKATTTTK